LERNNFRITVKNDKEVLAEKSDGSQESGEMQFDELRLATIEIFNDWLYQGKITQTWELEVLGTHLYKGLFCEEVATFFEQAYQEAQESGQSLCIQLDFWGDADRLSRLPWEYLYYPGKGNSIGFWLATYTKLVLARHIPIEPTNVNPRRRKQDLLHILIVTSEPTDLGRVAAQPVIEAIKEIAKESELEVDRLDKPTIDKFQKTLQEKKPLVLHFIGHGRFNKLQKRGEIALLDEDEKTAVWCSEMDFAGYFQEANLPPRLIFLHLCEENTNLDTFTTNFTALAPPLLGANIQAVVAMQHPMKTHLAIKFCETLYDNLAKGRPVTDAVQKGRSRIYHYTNDDTRFGTPVLYIDNSDGIILHIKAASGLRKQATRAI
jgi:CHAT domain-containing protein